MLSFQVMVCWVPACQLSPPFGDVTVINEAAVISKNASDKSFIFPSFTLVIFTV
jgi:hypothetical protein